jgi:hypothetical protein
MSRFEIENKMLELAMAADVAGLTKLLTDLKTQRRKLDAWFDKYLEMFDSKMNKTPKADPVWKMYDKKYSEYQELESSIKRVNYYREKYANV